MRDLLGRVWSVQSLGEMEGSEYLRKGKRKLDVSDWGDDDDDSDGDELQEKKRKAMALRALLDVGFVELMQKHLGPYLHRVISEAFEPLERAVSKLNSPCRCSAKQADDLNERCLQLRFLSRFSVPIFTERKIEWEKGSSIHVGLFDATTGGIVTSGPESLAKLDVLVLEGGFNNGDDEDWSSIEFEKHVVNERIGRRPLLIGQLQVQLKEGVGTLGHLSFTDNSSWVPSKMFRFGLKVAPFCCEDIRIREAKTEAFAVKDHRGESYKKHYPPTLDDEIWRVTKIKKDGPFCKNLNNNDIWTVRDFLRFLAFDPKSLRETPGAPKSKGVWKAIVNHAKTCILNEKRHVYHLDKSKALLFNDIYELVGLIINATHYTIDFLLSNRKVFKDSVDDLLRKAYGDWGNIKECDVGAILDLKLNGADIQRMPDGTSCSSILVNQVLPTVEADLPSPSIELYEIPDAMTNDNFSLPIVGASPPVRNTRRCTSNPTQILRIDSMVELADSPQVPTSGFSESDMIVEADVNHDISESLFGEYSWSELEQMFIDGDYFSPGNSSQQNCCKYDGPVSSAMKADKRWRKLGAILIWRFNIRRKIIKARQRLAPLMPVPVSS